MDRDDKVSVLIPTYNVEPFVREAILSIVNQTYKNLEIIIVDDGSTDDTFNILEELSKEDDRIILKRNKHNLNIVKTLNRALNYATGEFIARMDGDDISELSRIEKQVKFLKENRDIDLVGSHSKIIDEFGNITGELMLPVTHKECISVINVISPVSHIWLTSKALYHNLNGYRNLPGSEDYDFLLRAISFGYKIANYNEKLYQVRVRKGNSNTTMGLRQYKTFRYARKLFKERLKFGKDFYTEENYYKAIHSYPLTEYLYKKSFYFLYKAQYFNRRGCSLCKYFMLTIYLIVCPYSFRKIYKNIVLSNRGLN